MNINKNPFRYKSGEVMTHEEVRDLFANPPGFEMYKSSLKHCIIIGSKGSGKSILLKSLSIQVQSLNANIEELDYCGIYIERIIQANKFVELSKKFEMNDIFEHYFTLVVIAATANQLSDIVSEEVGRKYAEFINKRFIKKLKKASHTEIGSGSSSTQLPENNLKQIASYVSEEIQDLLNKISPEKSNPEDYSYSTFWKLGGLLQFLKGFYEVIKPFPKLCFLIDGFEDLEDVGLLILNNFVRHENLTFLCVKIGARRTHFDLSQMEVEYERDFDITYLDCNPNKPEHIEFLQRFANRKVKVEWDLNDKEHARINIDSLLPSTKPQEVNVWDGKKSPAEIFKKKES